MLISIRVAQENTDQLLQQTASQRLDAAIVRVERYLEPVADDVEFLAGQLSREGDLSRAGDEHTETLMRGSLGAIPQVVAMAFVRPDLTAVRARRERRPGDIHTTTGSLAGQQYGPELLEAGKRVEGVAWNSVFYVHDLGVSFISAISPVVRNGQFKGVMVAAVAVDELSLLMDSGDPDSTMFILSATDEVIAHPAAGPWRLHPDGGPLPPAPRRTERPRHARPLVGPGRRRHGRANPHDHHKHAPRRGRRRDLRRPAAPVEPLRRPALDRRDIFPDDPDERADNPAATGARGRCRDPGAGRGPGASTGAQPRPADPPAGRGGRVGFGLRFFRRATDRRQHLPRTGCGQPRLGFDADGTGLVRNLRAQGLLSEACCTPRPTAGSMPKSAS